ncbi:MAG: hypothetical protein CMC76_12790 [Flavobacteriaceae bacterium]|nr:hypothetical protein [Flavobacteriaceae bacterium]
MTLPYERTRAIVETEKFLKELSRDSGLPQELRTHAKALLRHYPSAAQVFSLGRLEEALMEDGPDADCSGQLIPDTVLSFSSATTGAIPPLKAWGRS